MGLMGILKRTPRLTPARGWERGAGGEGGNQASLLTTRESSQKAALNYLVCLADLNGKDGWGGGGRRERSHRAVGWNTSGQGQGDISGC